MKELKVRLMERMLGAELTAPPGHDAGPEAPAEQTNRRKGAATKRVKGADGEAPLAVPPDREGSFAPQLVGETTNATGSRE
jgi:transposase-like protein